MLDLTSKNAFVILQKYLEKNNKDKFEHSIRVAQTSKKLAKLWNVYSEDVVIAALLHDIGKCFNRAEMLVFCSQHKLPVYDFEVFDNLSALHGRISAYIFENEFKDDDIKRFKSISHAISSHVAGDEYMSDLDKILFIADNIEPARGNNMLSLIESGVINSPNECIEKIISEKIRKSNAKNRAYNPFLCATLKCINTPGAIALLNEIEALNSIDNSDTTLNGIDYER